MSDELSQEEKEKRFGKQVYNERIELSFGAVMFIEVIDKNGAMFRNISIYGGKDYQTKLGTPSKKVGLHEESVNKIINALQKTKIFVKK